RASQAIDQSNYYGSLGYDYDHASQDNVTARVEHDVNPNLTLRNQAFYNRTSREAVITSIQSPTSFSQATNLVTLSRQGNEQQNPIVSNQTGLIARFSTGRARHSLSTGLEYSNERLFSPTLAGVGTRAPVDIAEPNPHDVVTGYAPAPTAAYSRGR